MTPKPATSAIDQRSPLMAGDDPPFHCPVCDRPLNGGVVATEETGRGREVAIRNCSTCGVHVTWPRLPDPGGGRSELSPESWEAKYGAIDRGERAHDREQNYRQVTRLIREYVPGGRVLDVGCHSGWLLGYLQRSGAVYELEGLEPSTTLAQIARQRLGISIHNAYLQELADRLDQRYDAVVATDVIEHVAPEDINGFLRAVRKSLKPGGHFFVKTPNVRFTAWKSRVVRSLPRRARGFLVGVEDLWNAKEHVTLWDATSLTRILNQNRLRPVRMFVPLPIQTSNSPVAAHVLRSALYRLAHLAGRRQTIPAFAQDIFVVAERVS